MVKDAYRKSAVNLQFHEANIRDSDNHKFAFWLEVELIFPWLQRRTFSIIKSGQIHVHLVPIMLRIQTKNKIFVVQELSDKANHKIFGMALERYE